MRGLVLALLLTLAATARPVSAADPDPEARYQALVAKAKAGDPSVDWQALRFAYAERPGFSLVGDGQDEARKAMLAALNGGDFAAALAQAKLIIDQDFVDGEAHLVADITYQRLGQAAAAAREQQIGFGLFRSIQTGDGKTGATAFTVIRVSEEYSLMRLLGRRVTRQSLQRTGGHAYDVVETMDAKATPATYYFLIDRVMAAETKEFTPKP